VRLNLADPRVSVRVSPGGTEREGTWVTSLLPTSEIVARDDFDLGINGDFFEAKATKDIEGKNTGYIKGKPAAPVGMAMTDGHLWHQSQPPHVEPYLEITATNTAVIVAGDTNQIIDYYARQMVGGSQIIVSNGVAIPYHSAFATNRHPRTVVGVSRGGSELTLLVVDGRQPDLSIGMTLAELSKEMIRLGCDDALNLDGGGSTTLVYRDQADHRLKILNSPSDKKERSVADILEIKFDGPLPEPK
jgi:exopolysaccharide biosynthesis protein